jgi:hypothetical protein
LVPKNNFGILVSTMTLPSTAKELARELSPMLEEVVNLRYLMEHHASNRAILNQHETDALDRLVKRTVEVLAG